jgi:hypothetical protein
MSGQQGQQGQQAQHGHPEGRDVNVDALLPNEQVIVDERPAWTNWTLQLFLAGVVMLLGLVSSAGVEAGTPAVLGILIGLLIVGYVWYKRRRIRYLVTDYRILVVTGITTQATNEAWLEDIKGMQTGASFFERVLGHGHITVSHDILPRKSALPGLGLLLPFAQPHTGLELGGVKDYQKIANLIRKRQAQRKG